MTDYSTDASAVKTALDAVYAKKTSLPTKTSDLTNDGDGTNAFLTQHQSLTDYVQKSNGANTMTDSSAYSTIGTSANATQKQINAKIDEKLDDIYNTFLRESISISASRPYLLSGEKTDLIVTLHDGVGTPLANKSVTVSDGTSSYSGLTNLNGIFTLYNVSVTGDTTFTATYSNVSDSVTVEYCLFVDYGVTGNSNLTNVSTRGNVTVTNNGTLLEKGSYSEIYIRPNSFGLFTAPFTVKMTITDGGYSSSTKGRLVFQGFNSSTTSLGGLDTGNVLVSGDELRCDFTSTQAKLYLNGTLVDTKDYTSTSQIKLNIRNNQTGCYIKYKDLRIKSL